MVEDLLDDVCARDLLGLGFVCGDDAVPEDVKQLAPDVLGHRVITTYEAEAEEITGEIIVQRILDNIDVP